MNEKPLSYYDPNDSFNYEMRPTNSLRWNVVSGEVLITNSLEQLWVNNLGDKQWRRIEVVTNGV